MPSRCVDSSVPYGARVHCELAQLLLPFLRHLLVKPLPNPSIDLLVLLAGTLDKSDVVFSVGDAGRSGDLAECLAELCCRPARRALQLLRLECACIRILCSDRSWTSSTVALRRAAIRLALVFVASNGQNSINAFMLRRDLFTTLANLMHDPETTSMAFNAALLIGLLANFRKFEARNPVLMRLEDLVDDQVMRVRSALCCHDAWLISRQALVQSATVVLDVAQSCGSLLPSAYVH